MEGEGRQTDRLTEKVGGVGGRARGRETDRQSNQERWRRKDGKGERQTNQQRGMEGDKEEEDTTH